MTTATFNLIAPASIPAIQAASGNQYQVNSAGLITGVTSGDLSDCIKAGFLVVGYANDQAVFGASGINFFEEGNLYRNIGNAIAGNGADTTDDILGGFQIPASAFDKAGRGLNITAAGITGATTNNKRFKLFLNPTMSAQTVNADGSISGGTVSAGTPVADSGAWINGTTPNSAAGWTLNTNLFKYGPAGSNTQYAQSQVILGTLHGGIAAPQFLTLPENAVINVVVTGSSYTTGAASDVKLNFLEINAMN